MDILQIAIEAEGGVGKLAAALGEKQNVVSNWRARRLPRPWAKVLALKYGKALPAPPSQPEAQQPRVQAASESVAHEPWLGVERRRVTDQAQAPANARREIDRPNGFPAIEGV
jgi:hypothetical protein